MKSIFYKHLGVFLWSLAALFALLPSWPHLYYRLSPNASQTLASTIASTTNTALPIPSVTENPKPTSTTKPQPTATPLPPVDPSLPSKNGLIINSIGVKGEINEGEDWEKILKKGIWRVPNFGSPSADDHKPIIIAAHRWGYLEWSAQFRKLNSFYNLPKLNEGDKIELIWDQRKYIYEVTTTTTDTEITDYDYDLILYTCQLWNSPVRFFVFATRTN